MLFFSVVQEDGQEILADANNSRAIKSNNRGGPVSAKERKSSMKKVCAAMILSLGLSAVSVFASQRMTFVADDQGPVDVPVFPPIGTPPTAMFYEPEWAGTVSKPSALSALTFTWTAFGTFTMTGTKGDVWDIRVQGITFVMTFDDKEASTIQGVFHTTGTLDPDTFDISSTGTYEFISGTGIFAKVKGAGTIGAETITAGSEYACPMTGWIEY